MIMRFDWGRLSPRFWLQNDPTDWEWDAMLNRLLDEGHPVKKGYLTVTIGPIELWVGNWPFAYGSPYTPNAHVLPSVATRKRLKAYIPPDDPLEKVRNLLGAAE